MIVVAQKAWAIETKTKFKKVNEQRISQQNGCKKNKTCINTGSNHLMISTMLSGNHTKTDNNYVKQSSSNNQLTQVNTPILLPFP